MIIRGATQSEKQVQLLGKQLQFLEIQTRLMAELLKKQGVADDDISEIINLDKSYFKKKA